MRKLLIFLAVFGGLGLLQQNAIAQVPLAGYANTIGPNDIYPTHLDELQRGGYRTVETLADRDSISNPRRKFGMLVFVKSDNNQVPINKIFMFKGAIPNAPDETKSNAALDWEEYAPVGSGGESKFSADLVVAATAGFGKYKKDETIPALNKTAREVIEDAIKEEQQLPPFLAPTLTLANADADTDPDPAIIEIGTQVTINLVPTFAQLDGGPRGTFIFTKTVNGVSTTLPGSTDNIPSLTVPVSYTVSVSYAAGATTKTDNLKNVITSNVGAGTITSNPVTFTPKTKRYWGRIIAPNDAIPDATDVKAATGGSDGGSDVLTGKAKTGFNVPPDPNASLHYFFFAYPASYGLLTKDFTLGATTTTFTHYDVTVTTNGIDIPYHVYVSPNATGGDSGLITTYP